MTDQAETIPAPLAEISMAVLHPTLRALDHRLVWWMLAHQARGRGGAPTGTVAHGWRARAMKEFGVSKHVLYLSQQRLKKAGIIEATPYQRNVRIRGEAFETKEPT